MTTLLMVFVGQCVFAVIVIVILKNLLDRELMNAALEKFESCKASDIKEISVYTSSVVSDKYKSHLESIRKRKFLEANLNFKENAELKGGIVIAMGDLLLDFSLSSRLHNFWS